jgi:hypothetical protein
MNWSLFRRVSFHPLPIHQLAVQLKTRRVAELGERLESLLAEGVSADIKCPQYCRF